MVPIRKHSGEIIEVDPDGPLDAEDLRVLLGEEPDPLISALVKEIRRLSDRLASLSAQQKPDTPIVNVQPAQYAVQYLVLEVSQRKARP